MTVRNHEKLNSYRKRYEEIGSQQRMCEFLKRSFSKDSKEYAKVLKISSKLNIEKEQVSKFSFYCPNDTIFVSKMYS